MDPKGDMAFWGADLGLVQSSSGEHTLHILEPYLLGASPLLTWQGMELAPVHTVREDWPRPSAAVAAGSVPNGIGAGGPTLVHAGAVQSSPLPPVAPSLGYAVI